MRHAMKPERRGPLSAGARERRAAPQSTRHRANPRDRVIRRAVTVVVIAGVLAGLASAALAASARSHQVTATVAGPTGPEGIPLQSGPPLAPESAQATGQPVDGIGCNANEQVNYHIHAHLTVYVNGLLRPIPAGVGLVGLPLTNTLSLPLYGPTRSALRGWRQIAKNWPRV